MGVEKNIIAIELGSSSIRGIVGQRKSDGSLQVLGYEKESTPDCVRKGVIYNIDKTTQAIANIVKRIEDRQKVYVNKAYVGVSGQSLRAIRNCVTRQLDVKVAISEDIVESLKDINRAQPYPEAQILDVAPQEYRVGSHLTTEPVGIMADRIEGYFMNVIARKTLYDNIQRCMQGAKLEVVETFISPLLLANYLLSTSEKSTGCALVDFGADTTTVSVYEKNILRHLVVIPLGGNNITADIANSQHVEFEEAEMLKRQHGSAFTEEDDLNTAKLIDISNDRKIAEKTLFNIIEARQQEILENVWQQIRNYSDRLLSGVFFTGGGANMRELEKAFTQYTHFEKVKTRQMPSATEFTTNLKLDYQTNTLATLVAMLRRGDQECTSEKPVEPDLFPSAERNDGPTQPAASPAGQGVVGRNESKTPESEGETGTKEPEDIKEPKGPSKLSKFLQKLKQVTEGLVEEK